MPRKVQINWSNMERISDMAVNTLCDGEVNTLTPTEAAELNALLSEMAMKAGRVNWLVEQAKTRFKKGGTQGWL